MSLVVKVRAIDLLLLPGSFVPAGMASMAMSAAGQMQSRKPAHRTCCTSIRCMQTYSK